MSAPAATLQLPVVLKPVAGRERLEVHGYSVAEALESAFEVVPLLRHHLTLETGELRPHVLVVLNGTVLERGKIGEAEISTGDEILIHQAISGG